MRARRVYEISMIAKYSAYSVEVTSVGLAHARPIMSPTCRHTMKLLFVVSLCAFFAATGSVGIMKRQNPAACAGSDLINATVGSTSAACQATALYNFSAHFMGDTQQTDLIRTLCEPSCGKPVLRFFNECLGADVARLAVQLPGVQRSQVDNDSVMR